MQNLKSGFQKFAAAMKANLPNAANDQLKVIREEGRELYNAYNTNNQKEIVDGMVDTLFTCFVYAELIGGNVDVIYDMIGGYEYTAAEHIREYYFSSFTDSMKQFLADREISHMIDVMHHVVNLSKTYKHKFIDALNAVVAENLTKLEYPTEMAAEVWRDNKLQKKDRDGKLYDWYKPAQFAQYLRYENIFDMTSALVLDTETTGLSNTDEAVQIAIVDIENACELANELIKPTQPIPEEVIKIHGISNEAVADAEPWSEMHSFICDLLKEVKTVYIYKAEFDTRIIEQTAAKYNLRVPKYNAVCVMGKYTQLWGETKEYRGRYQSKHISLVNACKQQNIDVSDLTAHDALSDCLMTIRLMEKLNTGEYNTFKG